MKAGPDAAFVARSVVLVVRETMGRFHVCPARWAATALAAVSLFGCSSDDSAASSNDSGSDSTAACIPDAALPFFGPEAGLADAGQAMALCTSCVSSQCVAPVQQCARDCTCTAAFQCWSRLPPDSDFLTINACFGKTEILTNPAFSGLYTCIVSGTCASTCESLAPPFPGGDADTGDDASPDTTPDAWSSDVPDGG